MQIACNSLSYTLFDSALLCLYLSVSFGFSRYFLGAIVTLMEPSFLLSRTGLAIPVPFLPISDAKHCSRSRKRLQPPLQSFATVPANVCGKSLHLASVLASTCNRPRKYVHPSLQVRASEIVHD